MLNKVAKKCKFFQIINFYVGCAVVCKLENDNQKFMNSVATKDETTELQVKIKALLLSKKSQKNPSTSQHYFSKSQ
jgi:hypothetical protein